MGSDMTWATVNRASDKITATTLTSNREFWQDIAIAQVASTKWHIVQIKHTWLHHVVYKHSDSHPEST